MADGNITVEVSTQAAQAELQRLREALAWYGDEASALARHMASGAAHSQAVLASVTVLALDAGMRAKTALGSNA